MNIDTNMFTISNLIHFEERLLSGGNPSTKDLRKLKKMGWGAVLDLRTSNEYSRREEKQKVESLGLRFYSLPVSGKALTRKNVSDFVGLLDQVNGKSLFVYCGSGNRVGALFALKAFFVDGKSIERALAYGKSSGLKTAGLTSLVRDIMQGK